jgi:ATP-dependent DNA helicase RecG
MLECGKRGKMTALSDDQLETLLIHGEEEYTERKSVFNKAEGAKIRQAICAFANDLPGRRKPGVVFVGVADDGSCASLPITDELLKTLAHIRDDGLITPFPQMEVRKAVLHGCEMAVIVVHPADNPPIRLAQFHLSVDLWKIR